MYLKTPLQPYLFPPFLDSENCQYQFQIPSHMLTVHKNYHFICQVIFHSLNLWNFVKGYAGYQQQFLVVLRLLCMKQLNAQLNCFKAVTAQMKWTCLYVIMCQLIESVCNSTNSNLLHVAVFGGIAECRDTYGNLLLYSSGYQYHGWNVVLQCLPDKLASSPARM